MRKRWGTLGGHRGTRIGYVSQRVFFLDERQARAEGYRPCAVCMPEKYKVWRKKRSAKGARRA